MGRTPPVFEQHLLRVYAPRVNAWRSESLQARQAAALANLHSGLVEGVCEVM